MPQGRGEMPHHISFILTRNNGIRAAQTVKHMLYSQLETSLNFDSALSRLKNQVLSVSVRGTDKGKMMTISPGYFSKIPAD